MLAAGFVDVRAPGKDGPSNVIRMNGDRQGLNAQLESIFGRA